MWTLHMFSLEDRNPDGFALRFIEIRNTNAAAQVAVAELVNATSPDVVLTMEVFQQNWVQLWTTSWLSFWLMDLLKNSAGAICPWCVRRHSRSISSMVGQGHINGNQEQVLRRNGMDDCWQPAEPRFLGQFHGVEPKVKISNFPRHTFQPGPFFMFFSAAAGRQKPFALCRDWVLLLRWAACLGNSKDLYQVVEMVVLWQDESGMGPLGVPKWFWGFKYPLCRDYHRILIAWASINPYHGTVTLPETNSKST